MAMQGRSIAEIISVTDLSSASVYRLLAQIREGDEFQLREVQFNATIQRRRASLDQDIENLIQDYTGRQSNYTLAEISNFLSVQSGRRWSITSTFRQVSHCNISRKRLQRVVAARNSDRVVRLRAEYASVVVDLPLENLIFLDETGFNHYTTRNYGYSPVGTPATLIVPTVRGINQSLMCAISTAGLISWSLKGGAYNTQTFKEFIVEKLVPYFRANPEKILVMDNVQFHKTVTVQELLRDNNIRYMYLPPYSPQLNPIEEFFSMIKARYKQIKTQFRDVRECVEEVLIEEFLILACVYTFICTNGYKRHC